MSAQDFFAGLVRRRRWVLAGWLCLVVGLAVLGLRVRTDFSVEQFFPLGSAERKTYAEYKRIFPREDAQVALFWEEGRPLDAVAWADMAQAARMLEDAGLQGVAWLGNAQVVGVSDAGLVPTPTVTPLLDTPAPDQGHLAEALARHRDDPLLSGLLWSRDQRVFALGGTLKPEDNTEAGRRKLELDLTERLASLERPGRTLVLNGVPILRARYLRLLAQDQVVFLGAGFAMIFALLFLVFRNLKQIFLAFSSIVPSYLFVLGCLAILDRPITALTSALPLILVTIGLTDNVHLLVHYRKAREEGMDSRSAAVHTLVHCYGACFFTALTTAVGFASLAATSIDIVVDFAVFTSLGILFGYGCNMVFMPALLSLFPRARFNDAGLRARWMERLLVTAMETPRRRGPLILAGTALLCLLCLGLASRLQINAFIIDDLREDHPIQRDLRWIDSQGFGVFEVVVFLERQGEQPLYSPEMVRWMEELQSFAAQHPIVVRTSSLASPILAISDKLGERHPGGRLQDDAARIERLVSLGQKHAPELLADMISKDLRHAQVRLTVKDAGTLQTVPLLESLDAYLASHPPPGASARLTGTVLLAQTAYREILGGLGWSLLADLVTILAIMLVLLRSLRLALMALVTNVVPLVILCGVTALLGKDIKPSTVLVYSLVFGIAVDDTIHLVGHLRALTARSGITPAAIREVLAQSGRAVIITCLVICAGFGGLMWSSFELLFLIGLLSVVSLASGTLCDLFLLPAMLHLPGVSTSPQQA